MQVATGLTDHLYWVNSIKKFEPSGGNQSVGPHVGVRDRVLWGGEGECGKNVSTVA